MNKTLLTCTIFLNFMISTFAKASPIISYKLIPGSNLPIDVYGKDIISLILETQSPDTSFKPSISPVREWNHFKCSHLQTLLTEIQIDPQTQLIHQTWDIQFTWTAGDDLSGCNVDISFPNLPLSRANLYMDKGL